jgi:Phasin protein
MSNRFGSVRTDNSPNMFLVPALALSMWNPFLAGALRGNAQANEGIGTIASEWQDFVARRLKEDLLLMQRLTRSGTPDQVLAAYTDFWRKAAEDYGHEITTMSKLMTGVTTKMVTATQSAVDEASTRAFPSREAA